MKKETNLNVGRGLTTPIHYFADTLEDVTIKDEDLFKPYTLTEEDKTEIFKEIKEELFSTMHLSELVIRKKPFNDSLEELLNSKESIKSYISFKKQMENFAKDLNHKDIGELNQTLKISNDEENMINNFIDEYSKNYAKITFVLDTINSYIDKFGEKVKSTKFLNEELKYSIQNNINKLNENKNNISEKEYNSKIKKYNICLEAIENRENIEYIKSKFNAENKSFMTFIKKNQKFDADRIRRSDKILGDNITSEQIVAIIDLLNKTFNDEYFSITLIDYSAHMLKSGIGTGHFMYWKLFLLNLASIAIDQFDLEIGSEGYLNLLKDLYCEYIVQNDLSYN